MESLDPSPFEVVQRLNRLQLSDLELDDESRSRWVRQPLRNFLLELVREIARITPLLKPAGTSVLTPAACRRIRRACAVGANCFAFLAYRVSTVERDKDPRSQTPREGSARNLDLEETEQ